ncbi:15055_t:CDS:2 [Funneliformis mosseae]|uniref:15055_t:CDS:1 n=1 Tax=Funneliformis mosseae TaxID=27381 RepID=A0A9N9HGD5_FUNMO|nr:15055_t:CDS:2 [Funneliformis mosseae]
MAPLKSATSVTFKSTEFVPKASSVGLIFWQPTINFEFGQCPAIWKEFEKFVAMFESVKLCKY